MRVYSGKLNSQSKTAENELISLGFNGDLRKGTTAVLVGQWTKSYEETPKANYSSVGTVTKFDTGSASGGDNIEIYKSEKPYYWFEGTAHADRLKLTMKKQNGSFYGEAEMELAYKEDRD
ncbi:hypothetical protein BO70DRAFT_350655 [Aspergillus heteromorphus CBS 117.55]|uniref:Uncharacterized protein n=1 Tax=Aspergillus heteromorphus CBS 117.55 TaxID=1448321 RepID=A0A317WVG9_9EURO|nr:uncharacterized protein BO70DRAFT_350655 [Aspergillus heteromorphus CBS 117.55]PWY88270.1 hypothetical protein BO70DRAFT_350655 [Aspergillus heteromorphus CBS 117.55]